MLAQAWKVEVVHYRKNNTKVYRAKGSSGSGSGTVAPQGVATTVKYTELEQQSQYRFVYVITEINKRALHNKYNPVYTEKLKSVNKVMEEVAKDSTNQVPEPEG